MTNLVPINVIGGGGHAKVVVQAINAIGRTVATVFDDDRLAWGKTILSTPIIGPIARITEQPRLPTVIAIGANCPRKTIADSFCLDWITIVHPHAYVDSSVKLGMGTVVLPGAIVQIGTALGNHSIINTGACVDHDCVIGDYSHIAPGVHLAGGVVVGNGALMGIGSVAIPGTRIGDGATIGAGAAVVENIPENAVAVGVPAKVMAYKPQVETTAHGHVNHTPW